MQRESILRLRDRSDAQNKWSIYTRNHNSSITKNKNWSLEPAVVEAISFNSEGQMFLLIDSFGVVKETVPPPKSKKKNRNINSRWKQSTQSWPGFQFVNELTISADDSTAIIGSVQHGLVFWKLDSTKYKRIKLAPLIYTPTPVIQP